MLNKGAVDSDHVVDLDDFCANEFGEGGPMLRHNVRQVKAFGGKSFTDCLTIRPDGYLHIHGTVVFPRNNPVLGALHAASVLSKGEPQNKLCIDTLVGVGRWT